MQFYAGRAARPPMSARPSHRFSVIIAHRNGADLLARTLHTLSPACDGARDEIILVDNGSRDQSLAMVDTLFPEVIVITNDCNTGFAGACNQGLMLARGRYLLFLNNDTAVPDNLLDAMERYFETHPMLGLLGVQLVDEKGREHPSHSPLPRFPDAFDFKWRRYRGPAADPRPLVFVDAVVGACMAAKRAAIESAGPLDDAFFFYYEEKEWSHRMRCHGWQVAVAQDLRVIHTSGASTQGIRKGAELEMFRSRLVFNRRLFSPSQAFMLNTYWVARQVVNLLANSLITLFTFGASRRARDKLGVYAYLVAWVLCGRPYRWGLPDKCPRRRTFSTETSWRTPT